METARRTRVLVLLFGGLLAVVLIVLAAAGGSVQPWERGESTPRPRPTPQGTPPPVDRTPTPVASTPGGWDWLATGLLSAMLAVGLLVVARLIYVQVTRPQRAEPRIKSDAVSSQAPPTRYDELETALDAGFAALATASATDGVIRCWVALEEVAAQAGVRRDPAETSTEFTVRVLGSRDVPSDDLELLAALYREARFSDHGIDESARSQAQAALNRLRGSLIR